MRFLLALAAVLTVFAAGCSSDDEEPAQAGPAERIERAVTADGLRAHLAALERIADENDGTRASGTPGYDASVEYVVAELSKAGYEPHLHRFTYTDSEQIAPTELSRTSPVPATYSEASDFVTFRYSGSGDVEADVQPVDAGSTTSGCDTSDFDAFERGSVALLRRGGCFFVDKVRNAVAAGAAAVLVFNDGSPGHEAPIEATLLRPVAVPALSLASDLGEELASEEDARVHVSTEVETVERESANVLADLPAGADEPVVLLGAHLDSIASGPGINDNGSGVAAVLEIAEQTQRIGYRPRQPIRFAFWAAEEAGVIGSTEYVESLDGNPEDRIAAVVNLDMLGSPNAEAFVYEGDATIEQVLTAAVEREGLDPIPIDIEGRSDHAPFAEAGIPVGGLFTGADDLGPGGGPHDACYHRACDTIENVDLEILEQMADAVAAALLSLTTPSK